MAVWAVWAACIINAAIADEHTPCLVGFVLGVVVPPLAVAVVAFLLYAGSGSGHPRLPGERRYVPPPVRVVNAALPAVPPLTHQAARDEAEARRRARGRERTEAAVARYNELVRAP